MAEVYFTYILKIIGCHVHFHSQGYFATPIKRPDTVPYPNRSYANVGRPKIPYDKKSRTGQYEEAREILRGASCSKALLKGSKLAMDAIGNKDASYFLNELSKDPNGNPEDFIKKSSPPGCKW